MLRRKKNKEIVTELYVYVSESNKEWIKKRAKEKSIPMSAIVDRLITVTRINAKT